MFCILGVSINTLIHVAIVTIFHQVRFTPKLVNYVALNILPQLEIVEANEKQVNVRQLQKWIQSLCLELPVLSLVKYDHSSAFY